jgi:hypothetical protein
MQLRRWGRRGLRSRLPRLLEPESRVAFGYLLDVAVTSLPSRKHLICSRLGGK